MRKARQKSFEYASCFFKRRTPRSFCLPVRGVSFGASRIVPDARSCFSEPRRKTRRFLFGIGKARPRGACKMTKKNPSSFPCAFPCAIPRSFSVLFSGLLSGLLSSPFFAPCTRALCLFPPEITVCGANIPCSFILSHPRFGKLCQYC